MAPAAATSSRRLPGACAMSASVRSRYSGSLPGPGARASAMPCRRAQSFPVQPGSGASGETTVSGSPPCRPASSRASAPVPSSLPSSSRKRPPHVPDSPARGATAGSRAAPRPRTRRTTTATSGHPSGSSRRGSRWSVRQKKPRPSSSHTHAVSDPTAIQAMALIRRSLPHPGAVARAVDYGDRVKIALMDSGIGLLAAAAAVRRLRPDADLVLSSDPDGMPWGPRTPADVTEHALAEARAAAAHRPDALIVACNTASVHALPALRAELEPGIPVIGTVPAIKPAAAGGGPVAIWATPATTGSPYQRGLIREIRRRRRRHRSALPGSRLRRAAGRRRGHRPGRRRGRRPHPSRGKGRRPGLHPLRTGRRTHPYRRPAARSAARRAPRIRRSRGRQALRRIGRSPAPRGRARAQASPCCSAAGTPRCPAPLSRTPKAVCSTRSTPRADHRRAGAGLALPRTRNVSTLLV